jgi:hypothetical protein
MFKTWKKIRRKIKNEENIKEKNSKTKKLIK